MWLALAVAWLVGTALVWTLLYAYGEQGRGEPTARRAP
jgi:hypothetical protein